MQDIVLIPTYDRPELLWLCLEYMAASPESREVQILICVDAHVGHAPPPRAEIEEVIKKFPQLHIRIGFRPAHTFHGNSFNLMMAYRDLYQTEARYVFMVEDDVMIMPEFFAWHRQQHLHRLIGCSIGVLKRPEHGHYASLGVCFRREILKRIIPHCQTAYFQDMRGYCKKMFPPSKYDCEQDGLWCRVLSDQPVVWPMIAMAQHVGWYGYHRKKSHRPSGTLDQRYQQVKIALSDAGILHTMVREFWDVEPLRSPCN
jgi:hypothetical protein